MQVSRTPPLRIPEDNVARFRGRLRGLRDRWKAGAVTLNEVDAKVCAWIAHAEHADTWRLQHAIFRGRRFDPARGLNSLAKRTLLPDILK